MPHKLVWTLPADARLRRLRAEGQPWEQIALELGISRNAAVERGRRLGARLPPHAHKAEAEDLDRPAMAAGHWVSWGVITAATSLENEPYVYQAPSLRRRPGDGPGDAAPGGTRAVEAALCATRVENKT